MLQDTSTNGTMHNERAMKRGSTVVLSEGDKIECVLSSFPSLFPVTRCFSPCSSSTLRIGGHVLRYSHSAASSSTTTTDCADVFVGSSLVGDFLVSSRTLGSGAFSQVFLALSTKVSGPSFPFFCCSSFPPDGRPMRFFGVVHSRSNKSLANASPALG
jgi:hypothetical protein